MKKQNKITKKEDGHYYERIVTWKKKPDFLGLSLSFIYFLTVSYLMIAPYRSDHITAVGGFWLGFITTFVLIAAIALLLENKGKGRQVKFRRIK